MRLAGVAGIGIAALLVLVVPGEPGVSRPQPMTPAAVIAHVKRELGPGAELLGITFTGDAGNVRYRDGNGAAGYQWGPAHEGLEPVTVTLIGDGTLTDNVFPITKLDPDALARLTAAVNRAGYDAQSMTLAIDPATRRPRWTIAARKQGRTKQFAANSNGTRLKRSGYRQRT